MDREGCFAIKKTQHGYQFEEQPYPLFFFWHTEPKVIEPKVIDPKRDNLRFGSITFGSV
jgi:hypothetical protein